MIWLQYQNESILLTSETFRLILIKEEVEEFSPSLKIYYCSELIQVLSNHFQFYQGKGIEIDLLYCNYNQSQSS